MKICETCGKPIRCGDGCMQDSDGFFYTHEGECFEEYMDKTYGKGRWMQLGANALVGDGGFYIVTDDENHSGFDNPNIFCTMYELGDDPVFCDDITGWLGAVLESDESDIPVEARKHLYKAYQICAKALGIEPFGQLAHKQTVKGE